MDHQVTSLDVMDNKLKRSLEHSRECHRRYGEPMGKKLRLRLDALAAAESLGDFWPPHSGPERCHELKGSLAGTYSMDVKQPYRLLFKQVEDPSLPAVPNFNDMDGKDRWTAIRTIILVSVEDTHD